jgi:hypothetical protein
MLRHWKAPKHYTSKSPVTCISDTATREAALWGEKPAPFDSLGTGYYLR